MSQDTFDYVIAFTIAHEGFTPFMYNNWPLKNKNKDVTVGVGFAITSAAQAASPEIRNLFRLKGTTTIPDPEVMKKEYDRVFNLARTATNLHTDYEDKSPVVMDETAMRGFLREKMLEFWESKGQTFPKFENIPAQAQVALMSWNYGLRLSGAPNMCNAVRADPPDYDRARKETNVPDWDGQKNEAHARLFENVRILVDNRMDTSILPPIDGPFKPPPKVEAVAREREPLVEQSLR
jgi:hypothetical protein